MPLINRIFALAAICEAAIAPVLLICLLATAMFAQSQPTAKLSARALSQQSAERVTAKLSTNEAEQLLNQYGINTVNNSSRIITSRRATESRGAVLPLKGGILQDDDLSLLFIPGGLSGETIIIKQLADPYNGNTLTIGAQRFSEGLWEDFVFPLNFRTYDAFFADTPIVIAYVLNGGNIYYAESRVSNNYSQVQPGEIRSAATIGVPVSGGVIDRLHIAVDLNGDESISLFGNRKLIPNELIKRVPGGIEVLVANLGLSFYGPGKLPVTLIVNGRSSTAYFDYRGPAPLGAGQ